MLERNEGNLATSLPESSSAQCAVEIIAVAKWSRLAIRDSQPFAPVVGESPCVPVPESEEGAKYLALMRAVAQSYQGD